MKEQSDNFEYEEREYIVIDRTKFSFFSSSSCNLKHSKENSGFPNYVRLLGVISNFFSFPKETVLPFSRMKAI